MLSHKLTAIANKIKQGSITFQKFGITGAPVCGINLLKYVPLDFVAENWVQKL